MVRIGLKARWPSDFFNTAVATTGAAWHCQGMGTKDDARLDELAFLTALSRRHEEDWQLVQFEKDSRERRERKEHRDEELARTRSGPKASSTSPELPDLTLQPVNHRSFAVGELAEQVEAARGGHHHL